MANICECELRFSFAKEDEKMIEVLHNLCNAEYCMDTKISLKGNHVGGLSYETKSTINVDDLEEFSKKLTSVESSFWAYSIGEEDQYVGKVSFDGKYFIYNDL